MTAERINEQPFSVDCLEPSVPLFRLADGRFQLTKDGQIAPFIYGPGYFLVEKILAEFLLELDVPRISIQPAVIWHRGIGKEYSTHSRLMVDQCFTSSTINELDLTGNQLYSMDDCHLFVSPELKERLERFPFKYLRFSEGLSGFVAAR